MQKAQQPGNMSPKLDGTGGAAETNRLCEVAHKHAIESPPLGGGGRWVDWDSALRETFNCCDLKIATCALLK
jgi:hypothetical protein